jgi:hypothetical protein
MRISQSFLSIVAGFFLALSLSTSQVTFAEGNSAKSSSDQCQSHQAGLDGGFYTFDFTNVGARVKESDLLFVMNAVGSNFMMVGEELKNHQQTRCAAVAQIAHIEKSSEPGVYSLVLRVQSSCSDYDDFLGTREMASRVVVRLVDRLSKVPGLDLDSHWKAEGPCPTGHGGVTGSN